MLLQLLAAIVVAVSVKHGSGDLQEDVQVMQTFLQHLFENDMDMDGDSVTTSDEVMQYFHRDDQAPGDCQWTYNDFKTSWKESHNVDGTQVITEEQLRAMFFFYDTRGCSQAADGLFTCGDIHLLFDVVDADDDGQISKAESETGSRIFAQRMAVIIPTGTCPTMAWG